MTSPAGRAYEYLEKALSCLEQDHLTLEAADCRDLMDVLWYNMSDEDREALDPLEPENHPGRTWST